MPICCCWCQLQFVCATGIGSIVNVQFMLYSERKENHDQVDQRLIAPVEVKLFHGSAFL